MRESPGPPMRSQSPKKEMSMTQDYADRFEDSMFANAGNDSREDSKLDITQKPLNESTMNYRSYFNS